MSTGAVVRKVWPTERQARAFAAGIEMVNDGAISDVTVSAIADGRWTVTFLDNDADQDDYPPLGMETEFPETPECRRLLVAADELQEARNELGDALIDLINDEDSFRRDVRGLDGMGDLLTTYFARKRDHDEASATFMASIVDGKGGAS